MKIITCLVVSFVVISYFCFSQAAISSDEQPTVIRVTISEWVEEVEIPFK